MTRGRFPFPFLISMETLTREEKALRQLEKLLGHFADRNRVIKYNELYRYFKRLKIIFVVYMKERYNLTIRDTLSPEMANIIERYGTGDSSFFKYFFERLQRMKTQQMTLRGIEKLLREAISFFRGKVEIARRQTI
ncbi:MAG: hypothetical protein JXA18_08140 [Chitinispirillaceae bacterium]|nr:hypothetical protein [Chitinispirillaceae bacterium]